MLHQKVYRVTSVILLTALAGPFVASALSDELSGSSTGDEKAINDPLPGTEAADDLDALLELADNDFGQVARVNVTAPSLNVEVTTVSRKKSTVGRSPAAVYVISSEMIRRSGAQSIPEVLRMAPGVQVSRITGHQWAITIRGFNGLYSNKLQVQIDGRSAYTPLFGGVLWGTQGVPLSEIDRIEVIRGPGASVWGANAVNGIINIITKRAEETQGVFVQGGTGTMERGFTTLRYGTKLSDDFVGKVYGSWTDRNRSRPGNGVAPDDYRFGTAGFRIDSTGDGEDRLSLIGNYVNSRSGVSSRVPDFTGAPFSIAMFGDNKHTGTNILGRWEHDFSDQTKSTLQVFYDRNSIEAPFSITGSGLINHIDIFDVDHQLQHELNERHSLVMGVGYKYVSSYTNNVPGFLEFARSHRDFNLISAFIQDEITLVPEKSFLTVGAKVSDNSFSGFELQPTARLLWLPDDKHSVWAAVSRAVRLPTFFEMDGSVVLPPIATTPFAVFPRQIPSPSLAGQNVVAYEMGIRGQPVERFSWDLTTFINRYDNVGDGPTLGLTPVGPGVMVATQQRGNSGSAETYGTELSAVFDVSESMRVTGSYTYLRMYGVAASDKKAPINQLYLQSSMDLTETVEGDIVWRYVDSITGIARHYNAMDLRLAWRPTDNFEWAFVARNLLDDKHPEFASTPTGGVFTQVPTDVYSMVTFQY